VSAAGPALGLRLRPTMLSDLDLVVALERDEANLAFITPWERTQHEGAVRFPDVRHFIVEAGDTTQACGFVILQGCRNPHHNLELKRLVLSPTVQGRGLGRACVRWVIDTAFRDLGAHRLWLDVKEFNTRALHLYRSEGFVQEGRLRESVRTDEGWVDLIVMALLRREYEAWQAEPHPGPDRTVGCASVPGEHTR
jgi:diamine N-acetyltransferase